MRATVDRNIADADVLRYLVAYVLLSFAHARTLEARQPRVVTRATPVSMRHRRRDVRPPRAC